ncbi:LysR family transcriptional regulator [Serpentinimonas barnesii]|uniref:LysR family transcriptional regulator n=1 Tax=Serpentinimonas barnesii TaxID=1458427 RepID=UPI000495A43F|nr:LysR family transcriptional regulator [Serpentinimonas barnesii]
MNKLRPPRISFAQMRTWEAVARLGSITAAARELHLAQPTVSSQVHEMQAALGQALLAPAGRGIQITEGGTLLREAVLDVFTRWQALEEGLQALQGLKRGTLRIAGVTTTEYFIAQWISAFARTHPGIDIELAVHNRDAVVELLRSERVDLALMMRPPTFPPLHTLPVLDNPLVLIGPAGHPWAQRRRLPLSALKGQTLLWRESGSGTRQVVLEHLRANGLEPDERLTLGSNEAIKHAVAAGLGLAVLSRHALDPDPAQEGLALLPMTGFPILRLWQLVWRRDRRLPLAASAWIEHLRASLPVAFQAGSGAGVG